MDLADKHRPATIDGVVGQPEASGVMKGWLKKGVPHAVLFTGPSGTGKTTSVRALSRHLGCVPEARNGSYNELNAADSRGIDSAREIIRTMKYRSVAGSRNRVWAIDEAHKLTGDAQSALLKVLEDSQLHPTVWFMLATTDPGDLKPTLRGRCYELQFKPVNADDMLRLLQPVAEAEDINLGRKEVRLLVEVAAGCPRRALILLGSLAGVPREQHLSVLQKQDVATAAFDLVKIMVPFAGKPSWEEARKVIVGLKDENPEGLRQLVLKCADGVLLKGGTASRQAAWVIECFADPLYGGDVAARALLHRAVFNACLTGGGP